MPGEQRYRCVQLSCLSGPLHHQSREIHLQFQSAWVWCVTVQPCLCLPINLKKDAIGGSVRWWLSISKTAWDKTHQEFLRLENGGRSSKDWCGGHYRTNLAISIMFCWKPSVCLPQECKWYCVLGFSYFQMINFWLSRESCSNHVFIFATRCLIFSLAFILVTKRIVTRFQGCQSLMDFLLQLKILASLLHVSHKFSKVSVLQLPDWTRLDEIEDGGPDCTEMCFGGTLEKEFGWVRCHKQKWNREPTPLSIQVSGYKMSSRNMKRLKWGMDQRTYHSEEMVLHRSVQSWWTETLKYIWRANSISVGLFWWYSPSRPGGFRTRLCAQIGVCRLLLQILTRQLRCVWCECFLVIKWALFRWVFGSAWPECRREDFFLSQELLCECTAGTIHLWPGSSHRMRLWPARNNTLPIPQCGCGSCAPTVSLQLSCTVLHCPWKPQVNELGITG